MSDTVQMPRVPTDEMVRAAIEAGVIAARDEHGRRRTMGDMIRAEYAAMVAAAERKNIGSHIWPSA